MHSWEFFVEDDANEPWDQPEKHLDTDRLELLVRQREVDHTDLEMALALGQLAHQEFEAFGTHGGTSISGEDSALVMRALRAVLRRIGITTFDPPFRDFDTFYKFWRSNGGYGSWQARRDMLDSDFEPLRKLLDEREADAIESTLATPISPHKALGWPGVDEELFELRRHFESAVTEQDYSNVGNDAVAVLEALSRTVYDHTLHGTPGTPEPPIGNTKDRLDAFIVYSVAGAENARLRKLARAAIELAQETKHRRSGDRRSAGIAADAVILVANILRRIDPSQN